MNIALNSLGNFKMLFEGGDEGFLKSCSQQIEMERPFIFLKNADVVIHSQYSSLFINDKA